MPQQDECPPFLTVRHVWKSYPAAQGMWLRKKSMAPALRDVCLTLEKGRVLGLLGESGSGKSTLARLILGLESPDAGQILLEGQPVGIWRREHPGKMSVVFQDYATSVNPNFTVRDSIAEGCRTTGEGDTGEAAILTAMERAELPAQLLNRLPHQLSGGQVQRVCIARALASQPDFVVFDEAVSALDVSVQMEIVKLLMKIKGNISYLFITHDIQIASMLCDSIVILHKGAVTDAFAAENMGKIVSPHLEKLLSSTVLFHSTFEDTLS